MATMVVAKNLQVVCAEDATTLASSFDGNGAAADNTDNTHKSRAVFEELDKGVPPDFILCSCTCSNYTQECMIHSFPSCPPYLWQTRTAKLHAKNLLLGAT